MDPIIASEDTVEIPLTPERIHPKDATTSRRNSTGRVSTSSSGEKIIPNYLRASTNSCHDLCKYGGHHAFEAKERYPIPKRFAAVGSKFQIPAKSVTLQERKKKLEVKPKPLAEPKTQAPDKLKIVKQDIEIVTREVSSPSKQINVAAKLANVSKPPLSPLKKLDVTPKPATGLKPKPVTVNLPSSPLTSSSRSRRNSDIGIASNTISRRSNSDVGIVNNTRSSKFGERKSLAPPTSSLSPKPSGNGISSLSSRKPRVLKAATPLKNQSLVRNAEHKLPNDGKLKEKTLYAIEPKPRKKISSSSTSGSRSFNINGSRSNRSPGRSGSGSGSGSHGINGSDSNRSPSISGSRSPSIKRSPSNRSPSISGSHSPSINRSPSNRSPSLSGSRSSRTSSYSSSMYSSLSSSQSLCSDEEEEQDYESTPSNGNKSNSSKPKEMKNGNQVTSKAKHQRTRTGMVHSEERDLARKLKFRRGKVVNPEDEINNSRRLRFKQGKVLGDGQNVKGDLKRRIFRKRNDSDKNGTKAESEKVVLRHQDVQVTKDAQGLLNNVIEETASKLVEARKSKVRALVGAFETVISLQETKPAAASTNG